MTYNKCPAGPPAQCAANGEDCWESKCCSEPGMTCFQKNEHWASCNKTCESHMMWTGEGHNGWEQQPEKVWDCEVLSPPPVCTADHEDCRTSRCCNNPASSCYEKNEHWAECRPSCPNAHDWSCNALSCTDAGENCMYSRCCNDPGEHCYVKDEHWAMCNSTCSENMLWVHDKWEEQNHKVWNCGKLSCTQNGENCKDSRCCATPGESCYKKDEHWSMCNTTCNPKMLWVDDKWVEQSHDVWDCELLLP